VRRNRRFSADAPRDARLVAGGFGRAGRGERRLGEGVGDRGPGAEASTQRRLAQVLGLGVDDLEQPGPADAVDLRHLRESLGWTQAEAAQRLGLERSVLKLVEAGDELPSNPKRMARVYRVTAAERAAVVRRTG